MPDGGPVHPRRRLKRRLTAGEAAFTNSVFGQAIDVDRVSISSGGFGGFAVTLGSQMIFPRGAVAADFAMAPLEVRAWFVHELTHVWQFQTAPMTTLRSWAATLFSGGYGAGSPGYRYDLPFRFEDLALERQAKVVEHAYVLREGGCAPDLPPGATWADYAGATPFAGLKAEPAHAPSTLFEGSPPPLRGGGSDRDAS